MRLYRIRNIHIFTFALLVLILVIGIFRGEGIGTDYYNYKEIFETGENIEYGFSILISTVKAIWLNYNFFIGIVFLLSFICKWLTFKKMSVCPYLSLMIYLGFWFLVYDINGIRQGLSLGLIGLSLYSLWKDNNRYWVYFIISFLFHYSAIVIIPLFWLVHRQCSKYKIIFIFLVALMLSSGSFIEYVTGLFGIDSYILQKVTMYGRDDLYNSHTLISFPTVHRLFVFFLIYYICQSVNIDKRLKNLFLWCAILNIATYISFSSIEIIATRLSLGYRFMECISLSYLPLILKNNSRIVAYSALCIYVLFQIYMTLSMPDGNLLPYHF